ncbi:HAD-IIIA family hydrolase [Amycolatopsis acidiphila]|uniref:D,D-heptose 1,7-bisphosphate phosphatase n=1 Tax=Amycolatopsis acidiphila TaxID=715473 RepID=A0A557ZZQ1_9PSEU|nr:HAD-IIIA family hydrolase [Amycolatopsis acidiphila]TVT17477.1 HAD-IIIA family hydrolase [Amycolatopsis acidiphila]UIJ62192.1 HAD-IIIA family hydrolase [Amycolatopsis acidiphila]GHG92481.1 haloacid dehalogenase [Amycolatopsis acidiphila]
MRISRVGYAVVVPGTGGSSLGTLLSALEHGSGPAPDEVVVVDDRPSGAPLPASALPVRVVRPAASGPAAARNAGWRAARSDWIVFLDEDVRPPADWRQRLVADLTALPERVAGSRGHLVVSPPTGGRRATEHERRTVEHASGWVGSDIAYRRGVLAALDGFDERLFRAEADFALRVRQAGFAVERGSRTTLQPLRPSGFFASVTEQRTHAEDALLRRKFGSAWRDLAGIGPSPLGRHAFTTAAALAAAGLSRTRLRRVATVAGAAWLALTADLALRRILPGPRTRDEVARMTVTSALIPSAAVFSRLCGEISALRAEPATPGAVLFDRDDTLIVDEPYLSDAKLVRPVPGAEQVLRRLRDAGVPIGVVSNQSGVARGLITEQQLAEVNARVEQLLGPFDTWQVCVHGESDGCACRKPKPGLVRQAARALGVRPRDCVVIGDIGSDVAAARAAGATGILVPTGRTRAEEIRSAPYVAKDLREAVGLAMGERAW